MTKAIQQVPDPRIWVCDSMAYRLRDEFISQETIDAQYAYLNACKQQIPSKRKYYGDLYTRLHRADVERAQASVRATE